MTIKRSYFHLLFGSLGVALVLSNCTVKEDNDGSCEKGDKDVGCDCPGNASGYQECQKDGTFGSCICPDGSGGTAGTSNAGAPSDAGSDGGGTAGTGTGGTSGGTGGASDAGADAGGASEGGAGGEAAFMFEDCDECIATLCEDQFNACAKSEDCLDEYAAVSACIEEDRKNGLVTRDRVRGCGASLDPDAPLSAPWAPMTMTQPTIDLINCMASSLEVDPPNDDWANDMETNFPEGKPAPWPADSCAKLACTSKVETAAP